MIKPCSNVLDHPNRKLSKDVDMTTLYSMRDQGMSNQEIADTLGVSYMTILRYIGKNPNRAKRSTSVRKANPTNPDPVVSTYDQPDTVKEANPDPVVSTKKYDQPDTVKEAALVSSDILYSMQGSVGTYEINPKEKTIRICKDRITYDELDTVITELSRIRDNLQNKDVSYRLIVW